MSKVSNVIDPEDQEKLLANMQKGNFNLEDMRS